MKHIKRITIAGAFFIMIIINTSYSYTIDMITPKPCQSNFSFIHHPDFMLDCRFVIHRAHLFDSDTILYRVYIEQNGNSLMLNEGVSLNGELVSLSVNLQNFTHLCFNEIAVIRVDAKNYNGGEFIYSSRGFFVDYKSELSCRYQSSTNGSAEVVNQNLMFATFISACGSLASGNYVIRRYKTTFDLNGNFSDSVPVLENSLCLGYSGAGPNNQQYWAAITDSSLTHYRIVTFTYQVYNILGQDLGFWPCRPNQATIVYRFVRKPQIQNLVFFPLSVNPLSSIVHANTVLSSGNGNLIFSWRDSNSTIIPSVLEYSGNRARVNFSFQHNHNNNMTEDRAYYIFSKVANEAGMTEWIKRKIRVNYNSVTCPVLSSEEENDYLNENSILSSSYSYPGIYVKDFLFLENPFLKDKEVLNVKISESSDDHTELDFISIHKINVLNDESAAVTNSGETINFKSGAGKSKFIRNESEDITNALMYDDDQTIDMKKGDKIRIEMYDINAEYLILKPFSPEEKEVTAGFIKTNSGFSEAFYSRDNPSSVCIKLPDNGLNEITVELVQDVSFSQILPVINLHSFSESELLLKSAYSLRNKNVKYLLTEPDNNFLNITKGEDVFLSFENQNTDLNLRPYYLCISKGRIINSAGKTIRLKSDSHDSVLRNILSFNSPNPFNPVTKISFEIPSDGFVKLSVYDISGKEISNIVNDYRKAGRYETLFDGSSIPSGVYFYKIETSSGFRSTKKMTLIK